MQHELYLSNVISEHFIEYIKKGLNESDTLVISSHIQEDPLLKLWYENSIHSCNKKFKYIDVSFKRKLWCYCCSINGHNDELNHVPGDYENTGEYDFIYETIRNQDSELHSIWFDSYSFIVSYLEEVENINYYLENAINLQVLDLKNCEYRIPDFALLLIKLQSLVYLRLDENFKNLNNEEDVNLSEIYSGILKQGQLKYLSLKGDHLCPGLEVFIIQAKEELTKLEYLGLPNGFDLDEFSKENSEADYPFLYNKGLENSFPVPTLQSYVDFTPLNKYIEAEIDNIIKKSPEIQLDCEKTYFNSFILDSVIKSSNIEGIKLLTSVGYCICCADDFSGNVHKPGDIREHPVLDPTLEYKAINKTRSNLKKIEVTSVQDGLYALDDTSNLFIRNLAKTAIDCVFAHKNLTHITLENLFFNDTDFKSLNSMLICYPQLITLGLNGNFISSNINGLSDAITSLKNLKKLGLPMKGYPPLKIKLIYSALLYLTELEILELNIEKGDFDLIRQIIQNKCSSKLKQINCQHLVRTIKNRLESLLSIHQIKLGVIDV